MLKQIKVITVYLHRKKVIGPIIDHIFKANKMIQSISLDLLILFIAVKINVRV